jgi:hypothetical protein
MRQITRGLVIACTCAVATATFAGVALADKATAPGQEKHGASAQAQAQVQADVQAQVQTQAQVQAGAEVSTSVGAGADMSAGSSVAAHAAAPGQIDKSQVNKGQMKQQAAASSTATATADTSAGMKPSSSTTAVMWSQCTAGGASTAATCTATRSSVAAGVKGDVSKKYGNGDTAARIAVSRGGAGATLTGPGNSQPHKVSLCGRPGNPSGGVDVHAVKSYSSSACQASAPVHSGVTPTTTTTVRGNVTIQAGTTVQSNTVTQSGSTQSSSTSPTSPSVQNTSAGGTTNGTGGVLAAHASVTKPRSGVLGEVTNVAGSTLPFTGFPLWLVALGALGLIGGGLALRRGAAAPA